MDYLCEDVIEQFALGIIVLHSSASFVMPKGDPQSRISCRTLTLMIDFYNSILVKLHHRLFV